MLDIDRSDAISNLTLDLESGQFNFDTNLSQGMEWFNIDNSLQNAAIFDWRNHQEQIAFNDSYSYSYDKPELYSRFKIGEEKFDEAFNRIMAGETGKRDAINAYLNSPDMEGSKFETVIDVVTAAKQGNQEAQMIIEDAIPYFHDEVKKEMEARKKEEDKAKKDGDGGGSPRVASLPEVITGAQINVNNEGITGSQMMFSNLRT